MARRKEYCQNDIDSEQIKTQLLEARELFIQLFQDETPLLNMGYTTKQKTIVRPVLRLLSEQGVIRKLRNDKFVLSIVAEDKRSSVEIEHLLNGGWLLYASYEVPGGPFISNPENEIFPDSFGLGAKIALIPKVVDLADVTLLVRHLYEGHLDEGEYQAIMKPFQIINRIRSMVEPQIALFTAAWHDEGTKLELAVKNNYAWVAFGSPTDVKEFSEEYHIWRRLFAKSNRLDSYHCFGLMPNISQDKVDKILASQSSMSLLGSLTLTPNEHGNK